MSAEVEWVRFPHQFERSLDGQSCSRCGYFQPDDQDRVMTISVCYEENRSGEKRFVPDIEVMSGDPKPRAFGKVDLEPDMLVDPARNVLLVNLQDCPGVYVRETDDAIFIDLPPSGEIAGDPRRFWLWMRTMVRRGRARRYKRISKVGRATFWFRVRANRGRTR